MIFSVGWGGEETQLYQLAGRLRDRGENVSIVLNQEVFKYYADLEDVRLLNVGPLYPPKSPIPHPKSPRMKRSIFHKAIALPYSYLDELLRHLYFVKIRGGLVQFLCNNNVDVVNSTGENAVPLVSDLVCDLKTLKITAMALIAGEPDLRGIVPVHPLSRPLMKWKAKKFKKALEKTDKVFAVSDFVLKAWEDQGVLLKDKSEVIHGYQYLRDSGQYGINLQAEGGIKFALPGWGEVH
ncbi:hypothetical protein ACFLX5_05405 [Chloroflexota bacterium]